MELPGEQPMIEFPMPRVLGQVEELPISGIWSNQPDNITNPSDENDEKQKKLMTMVVLPASLLLALSLCGELYLRKRSKISTK
jgi:hypothetical protein